MNKETMKGIMIESIQSQARSSVMKYRNNNLISAAAYFQGCAILGQNANKMFNIQPEDKEFYIGILRAACRCSGVDYEEYFQKMCDAAYSGIIYDNYESRRLA